jgi:predicted dinucleotide-binding enzyme
VPRSPEQIQQEIDAARESLAATLDELSFRTSPQRLSDQARQKAGAVGLTVTFVATRRVVRGVRRARDRRRVVTVPVPVGVRSRRRH